MASVPRFRDLAALGDMEASAALAECYWLGLGVERDPVEGMRMLRQAAEAGVWRAAHNLAAALMVGAVGVKQDLEQARKYVALAAELGSPYGYLLDGAAEGVTRARVFSSVG